MLSLIEVLCVCVMYSLIETCIIIIIIRYHFVIVTLVIIQVI